MREKVRLQCLQTYVREALSLWASRRRPSSETHLHHFFLLLNGLTEFDDTIHGDRYFDSASFGTKL